MAKFEVQQNGDIPQVIEADDFTTTTTNDGMTRDVVPVLTFWKAVPASGGSRQAVAVFRTWDSVRLKSG